MWITINYNMYNNYIIHISKIVYNILKLICKIILRIIFLFMTNCIIYIYYEHK